MEPKFRIGEAVEFEIDKNNRPRWKNGRDSRGTGQWASGHVTRISKGHILVEADGIESEWPTAGSPSYYHELWGYAGYLRKKSRTKIRFVDMGGHYRTERI